MKGRDSSPFRLAVCQFLMGPQMALFLTAFFVYTPTCNFTEAHVHVRWPACLIRNPLPTCGRRRLSTLSSLCDKETKKEEEEEERERAGNKAPFHNTNSLSPNPSPIHDVNAFCFSSSLLRCAFCRCSYSIACALTRHTSIVEAAGIREEVRTCHGPFLPSGYGVPLFSSLTPPLRGRSEHTCSNLVVVIPLPLSPAAPSRGAVLHRLPLVSATVSPGGVVAKDNAVSSQRQGASEIPTVTTLSH